MIKIFPTTEKKFKLNGNQDETLERLNRRTERSDVLIYVNTDKSFIGTVDGSKFKVITSTKVMGSFCVMSGEISSGRGSVKVTINRVFRILIGMLLLFFVLAMPILAFSAQEFSVEIIIGPIIFVLFARFIFIGLTFYFRSKESLKRLVDVLDLEWI